MNTAELLTLFTREQRIEVNFPDMRREVLGSVIRQQVAFFERLGQNFEWKAYDYDPRLT
jgi:hypothetical protein